jgi:hypothetical protein
VELHEDEYVGETAVTVGHVEEGGLRAPGTAHQSWAPGRMAR